MLGTVLVPGMTCGAACWMAREDVCRCSCNGVNHGIMRQGGEQPERTRHKQGIMYQLIAVTSYGGASKMKTDDYGSWLDKVGYRSGRLYPHERVVHNKATASQMKWPEVQAVDLGLDQRGRPEEKHLVWERTDIARTW